MDVAGGLGVMMMEVGDEMKMARGWWWFVGVVRFGVGWIVLWGSLARSILASTGLSKPPPKTQTGPRALINHRLPIERGGVEKVNSVITQPNIRLLRSFAVSILS
jgi:hypothetical protein